jgi:hypothetical protein
LDHRIESSLRKGRQAAERGDIERIRRELDKLSEYSSELGYPELQQSAVLLYVWAGSERARDSISQAMTIENQQGPGTASPLREGLEAQAQTGVLTPDSTSELVVLDDGLEPAEVQVNAAPEVLGLALAESVTKLIADLQPLADPKILKPTWDLEEVTRKRLPEIVLDLPTAEEFSSELRDVVAAMEAGARTLSNQSCTIDQLPKMKEELNQVQQLLREKIETLHQHVLRMDTAVPELSVSELGSVYRLIKLRTDATRAGTEADSLEAAIKEIERLIPIGRLRGEPSQRLIF